ncbi:MAG: hypothetical protein SRB2_03014 [Desulfobacteraceae bacterium Eth-SRB2]|nr:MAG: hypothetical protein SRB2_03014 [Desulfobacteraceae bacterium Eth-SRB2]
MLDKDIEDIGDAVRAKKEKAVTGCLDEIGNKSPVRCRRTNLHGKTIYGCGLRLPECMNLENSDIDFSRMAVISAGKGDKDRKRFFREAPLIKF